MCSIFIWECPWDQYLWKRGEGHRSGQREKLSSDAGPKTALAGPKGTLELEWPFRAVLSWAKMAWTLSLWVGLERGMTWGKVALCSQDSSVAEVIPEGVSQQLGHQVLRQGDSGWYIMSWQPTTLDYSWSELEAWPVAQPFPHPCSSITV